MRTTFIAKTAEIERKWYVVDAEGQTLGRLASQLLQFLEVRISLFIHHTLIQVIM